MERPEVILSIEELSQYIVPELSEEESAHAELLIDSAESKLRLLAKRNGIDIYDEIQKDWDVNRSVKDLLIKSIKRIINQQRFSLDSEVPDASMISSLTISANPYSKSWNWNTASQDLYFSNKDLQAIGLYRNNKIRTIEFEVTGW